MYRKCVQHEVDDWCMHCYAGGRCNDCCQCDKARLARGELLDISGLDSARVIMALYNASKPQGAGLTKYDPKDMTLEEAKEVFAQFLEVGVRVRDQPIRFESIRGRPVPVEFRLDGFLFVLLYDRLMGPGAAADAIEGLHRG